MDQYGEFFSECRRQMWTHAQIPFEDTQSLSYLVEPSRYGKQANQQLVTVVVCMICNNQLRCPWNEHSMKRKMLPI